MSNITYDHQQLPGRGRRIVSFLGGIAVLLIAGGLIVVVLFPPVQRVSSGVPVSRKLSQLDYPSEVVQRIGQPVGGQWLLPTSSARIGDSLFVLDTGNNRILEVDSGGHLVSVLDRGTDERLDLRQPMAIATDGGDLFVANSLAGQIVVIDPSGTVERVIPLEAPPAGRLPRPIGVAVSGAGHIIVSDAENHRLLIVGADGSPIGSFGTGTRQGESVGLNVPSGIALDNTGYIYVVDTLNGRVVKLSPAGDYIRDFARLADTAGSLARPKGVAVDEAGRIFVSDGLQAAIEVFAADGTYLGVIGRRVAGDPAAGSIFEMPAALTIDNDLLTVVDSVLGVVVLRLAENGGQQEGKEP